jgi:HSP20 family protein
MLAHWPPIDPQRGRGGAPVREMLNDLYDRGVLPAIDLYLTDHDIHAEVAIPGADPSSIQVSLEGNTVTVTGVVHPEHNLGQPFVEDIWRGAFRQSFTLPAPSGRGGADAAYCDGMLRLKLPRAEAAAPELIPVRHDPRSEEGDGRLPQDNLHTETVATSRR